MANRRSRSIQIEREPGERVARFRLGTYELKKRGVSRFDARAQLNVLLTETSAEGKVFHRAQELRLERAHIPIFPLFWTLMHALDERSPIAWLRYGASEPGNTPGRRVR